MLLSEPYVSLVQCIGELVVGLRTFAVSNFMASSTWLCLPWLSVLGVRLE